MNYYSFLISNSICRFFKFHSIGKKQKQKQQDKHPTVTHSFRFLPYQLCLSFKLLTGWFRRCCMFRGSLRKCPKYSYCFSHINQLLIAPLPPLPFSSAVAQKVVAMRKKQQLSIGPCKSLPNSPSHSSVPAASIPSVHINQVRWFPAGLSDTTVLHTVIMFTVFGPSLIRLVNVVVVVNGTI